MLAPSALLRLLVSRALPSANTDSANQDVGARGGRYGELAVLPYVRKQHLLADEGSYFVAANAQTAITGQAITAFDATKPSLIIANTDSSGNPAAKRIYLDYIHLLNGGTAYSNGVSNTGSFWSMQIDNGNRWSSAGTLLTVASPNMDLASATSVAQVHAGALTVTTATAAMRTLVGYRLMRAPVSATALTLANVDVFHFNFGGVEAHPNWQLQASATVEATAVQKNFAGPPVVIGPGQSILFNIANVSNSAAVAGNFFYEVGWWER